MKCGVCGGSSFAGRAILWDGLINEWQLSESETAYVNRQQGESCNDCGSNLRSIALANGIRSYLGVKCTLNEAAQKAEFQKLSIFEINEAGNLTPSLQKFSNYKFGAYPEVDMHAMPFADASFDLVIHSDTLEHVDNPVHALSECRRILKPGGALCFTIPTIVGRMTRKRDGLPKSFHGNPATATDDFIVRTEFGADGWTYAMEAGFTDVALHAVAYPSAIAYVARNG
ncbi:methyltransferase domain-containing protein [Variovorax sp. HJSM1_2]|uniref:methyltransferase domain-containing protein n=1 Tax=Variovorax sp. HJSM1_2 TaxID=3366263 RepID=UPI003BCB3D59